MEQRGSAQIRPIGADDLSEVALFLHHNLDQRLSADRWRQAIQPSWPADPTLPPDHGYVLLRTPEPGVAPDIVGVYLAFHATRQIDGQSVPVCNLAAWCVLEAYRDRGVALLRRQLGRRGVTFTDLSPSGSVVAMNERLKFRRLDAATFLVPHVPIALARPEPGVSISADPAHLEAELDPADLKIYRDHRGALAARHLLLRGGEERGYLIFRRDRRRGLPVFASVLHVTRPELLRRAWPLVCRTLLLRHRLVATLAERHVVTHRPPASFPVAQNRPKMFLSSELRADQIDYLYSELTCVPW